VPSAAGDQRGFGSGSLDCVLLLLFFGRNKVRSTLETHSTKATVVGESKKAEVSAPEAQREFWGVAPDARAILQLFSQK